MLRALDLTRCTKLLVEEEKGAVLGAALALETGLPLAMARVYPYRVPGRRVSFSSEYSSGDLYINGIDPGDQVCIIDDTLSTGGTLVALVTAVKQAGAEVTQICVAVEKVRNGGREVVAREAGIVVHSLISIDVTATGVTICTPPGEASAGPCSQLGFLGRMQPVETPGLLVVVEGTDGAGKSTLVEGLTAALEGDGHTVVTTFQPSPTARATDVFRGFAERGQADPVVYRALYLVTLGDRLYHAYATILPALEAGHIVVCDRYIYTTIANMSARSQHAEPWFIDSVAQLPKPDVALLVHSPVPVIVERIRQRPAERDRPVDVAHLTRVYSGFQQMSAAGYLHGLDTSSLSRPDTVRIAREMVHRALARRAGAGTLAP
jgi:thymidylate kinase/adenine/guanine phosphoribosyltransferase-like PRPP-binding protein